MKALTHTAGQNSLRLKKLSRRRKKFLPRLFKLSPCLCVVLLFAPAHVARLTSAQDLDDATVEGRVFDEAGALVPGARVTAVRADNGAERTTLTDAEGRYRLVELEPGAYALRVSRAGFAAEEKKNVLTSAGRRLVLDFTLRPEGLTAETVVVSEAESAALDTTRTVVGATLARDELEQLPSFSRAPLDFIFTLGGVAEEPLSTRDAADDRDASTRGGSLARRAETPEEAGAFALSGGAPHSTQTITREVKS